MSKKQAAIIALVLGFAAASIALYFPKKADHSLPPDILARSHQYVQTLGSRPLDSLSMDDRLLLLHSYYNLKDYARVIQVGEGMMPALDGLPRERSKPYYSMLEVAYWEAGQSEKAQALASKVKAASSAPTK